MESVELIILVNGNRYSLPIPYDADFPVAVNRSVVDFEDVGKKKGDYSKTIKVQANQETNQVLRYLFLNTIAQDENRVMGLKGDSVNLPCELNVNGLPHMKGYCLIKSASQTGKPNSYEITIFSGMNDWADILSKTKLRELDLGLTHWSWATIKDSNQEDKSESSNPFNHVYPLIDYGDIGNKLGAGTALMDYEFRSAPFIRDMVLACFSKTGYTLTSDWLDNDDIRRLIYPFTSGNWKRSASVYEAYNAVAKWTTQQSIIDASSDFIINPNNEVSDDSNQLTLGTSLNIIPPPLFSSAPYTLTGLKFTAAEGGTRTIKGTITLQGNGSTNNLIQVWVHKGTTVLSSFQQIASATIIGGSAVSLNFEVDIYFAANEVVSICFWPLNNSLVNINVNSQIEFLAKEEIEIGGEYDLANTLPDKYAMEFIQGLAQLFNLVFDTDPLAKTVRIEPMFSWVDSTGTEIDGYYLGFSDAVDYSQKVQQHVEFKTDFLSQYKQELFWRYKEDSSDGILKARADKTGHIYGGYKHRLYKRFQKGTQVYENIHFGATYMGYRLIGGAGTNIQKLLVPMIMETPTSGYDQPTYKCEPRILYHKFSDHDSFFEGSTGSKHYEWTLKDSLYGLTHSFSTDAPRAFSVDCDGEVDFSLNFNDMTIPDMTDVRGMFWRFWSKVPPMINEGVKGTGMFKYLEIDNLNLSFRKLWYLNDVYWIVNKIIDYKPQEKTFTKVELLLKSELGKADVQVQPDGADGWSNPTDAATSGEVVDFNTSQNDGIYTSTGDIVTTLTKGPSIIANVGMKPATNFTKKNP